LTFSRCTMYSHSQISVAVQVRYTLHMTGYEKDIFSINEIQGKMTMLQTI
jgi:hypothetical protein